MGWNFVFELLLYNNIQTFFYKNDLKFWVSIYYKCVYSWKISISIEIWFVSFEQDMKKKSHFKIDDF
jgi:hypothetical protein